MTGVEAASDDAARDIAAELAQAGAGPCAPGGAVVSKRALDKCTNVIADPKQTLRDRAICAGALPGVELDEGAAKAALRLIARSARDIFGTIRAASEFLNGENFDSSGMTAKALVSRGRGTAVIARLDELRYGTQG